ncbi:GDSL-type esterase/lipase family protein [Streptomyces sp. NPDC051214]|uniref:GDSL-type esterase/lipase family protein n=1 Tax=Streptomyces sp. NPDC051214 TaxID=3155282 RepID=UPI003440FA4F
MTESDDAPPSHEPDSLARMPWRRFIVLGGGAEGPGPARGCGHADWADHVAEALRSVRPDLAYLNLGRHELSTAQVRAGQLARALAFRGDLAAVVAGGREVVREPFDIDAVETELGRIVGPLRSSGADVLTLGPYGAGLFAAPAEEQRSGPRRRLRILAERTRDLALRHGALYVDVPPRAAEADGRSVAAAVIHRLVHHLDATLNTRY